MSLSRNHFYKILLPATFAGYGWLWLVGPLKPDEIGERYDVCLIRHFLHVPCPSCGATRSVVSILHGDLLGGLYWNPLGFLIIAYLLVAPIWMGLDLVLNRDTFYRFFQFFEATLRRKLVAIPLVGIILLNWAWNIWKGV